MFRKSSTYVFESPDRIDLRSNTSILVQLKQLIGCILDEFGCFLQKSHVVAAHSLVVDDHSQWVVTLRVPPSLHCLPIASMFARYNICSAYILQDWLVYPKKNRSRRDNVMKYQSGQSSQMASTNCSLLQRQDHWEGQGQCRCHQDKLCELLERNQQCDSR